MTFETPRSVANKAKYAVENNLGGIWASFVDTLVDTDDLHGHFKPDITTYADYADYRMKLNLLKINEIVYYLEQLKKL